MNAEQAYREAYERVAQSITVQCAVDQMRGMEAMRAVLTHANRRFGAIGREARKRIQRRRHG